MFGGVRVTAHQEKQRKERGANMHDPHDPERRRLCRDRWQIRVNQIACAAVTRV
jgi:hypothetical protein